MKIVHDWLGSIDLPDDAASRYEKLQGKLPPVRFYLEFDLGGPITIGRGS